MLASYFWDIPQACVVCTHTSVNQFQISGITQINHCFFLYCSVIHEALSLKSNCICLTMKASIMRATYFPGAGPQFSSVTQSYPTFATPWTTALQASLSITNSRSLPQPMSIELAMPSNHLILCHPLLLLPSIFPNIRVFSNESVLHIRWPKYWSFSFSISPSNEHSGLISFRMNWLDLLAVQGTLKSLF